MKGHFFALLVLFFSNGIAAAQTSPMVSLNGMIILNGRDTVPYKVVLTDVNGDVKGYSLTYSQPYETKTTIKGVLDRHNHIFSFKETEIIYINGYHSGPSMCLVDASLEEVDGTEGRLLKGPITSKEADRTSCAGGKVIFANEAEIQNLFSYHEQYDTVISMGGRKKDVNKAKTPPAIAPATPLITDKVTAGEEKIYDWHTDTVIIDIWDGGNVDGDRVTLEFNGKTYLSSYFLVKDKKELRIPLSGYNMNTIIIHADNEGSDPPNTASILLMDGTTPHSVLAYNKKGQEAIIKLKRMK